MDNIIYKSIIIGTATKCKKDNNIIDEKIKMYRLKFSCQLKVLNFNDNSLKEDIEVLEDLIVAAMHEAKKNADNLSEQEMKSVTGGMPMPPGIKF